MDDQLFTDMWKMGRTRLTNQLDNISDKDLLKRVHGESNSVGWLMRHIAEVELLFTKNVFGQDMNVKAQTIGSIAIDRGQFNELSPLLELIERAEEELGASVRKIVIRNISLNSNLFIVKLRLNKKQTTITN